MFSLSKKKPRISDEEYVDLVFTNLSALFKQVSPIQYLHVHDLLEQNAHVEALLHFSEVLDLRVTFSKIDEIDELSNGLPIIYEWYIDSDDGLKYTYSIGITPFAVANPDIAFVELAMHIVSLKLSESTIEVPPSIWEDTIQRRQFLVLGCVFFGLGIPFLERNWINGRYQFTSETSGYTVRYYVPLHLDFLIYATALFYNPQDDTAVRMSKKQISKLTKDIRKEYEICINYLNEKIR